jgi:stage II sporulation protein D
MHHEMGPVPTIAPARGWNLRLLLVLALVAALLIPTQARADTTFNLWGSGNGHGVGLPQWGAYGLAAKGWTVNGIITHYFTGTTVGTAPSIPSKIRVGLLQGKAGINIQARGQAANLRLGSIGGTQIAQIPVDATWIVEVKSGKYWVKKTDGTYVGNQGYGDSSIALYAAPAATGGSLYLSQAGHTYKRGSLELNIYVPCTGCAMKLRAIQVIGPQGYMYGVAESPVDWGATAQQVQAITSRGYALWLIATYGQHRATCNCGVWSTTRDQYYVGSDRELASYGAAWISAVNATNGMVALYNGALAQTNFSSASGGYTENVEYVWGGTAYPYLRGVCDPGDYNSSNANSTWLVQMTGATMGSKVKAYTGTDVGTVTGFANTSRGVSGRIRSITVKGTLASVTMTGLAFRAVLGLKDDRVWINSNRNITGQMRITYDNLNCAPGLATSPQYDRTGGAYQKFVRGRGYVNGTQNRAYWLYGLVVQRYINLGQWNSSLGWPTSGIQKVDSNHEKATFQNGSISCTLSTSTCTVS